MNTTPAIYVVAATLATLGSASAQTPSSAATPVGVLNFVRAESDLYMGRW